MNSILLNKLNDGSTFSEDCYIFEDLFFLPKNFPIHNYHLKLLNKWNINEIQTDGDFSTGTITRLVEDNKDDSKIDVDKILSNENKPEKREEIEEVSDLRLQRGDISTALLDSSVKSFVEVYKQWIKETTNFFNQIILYKDVDKEKVRNFIMDIINLTNKNRNNALIVFGKNFEGTLYVLSQTIETIILTHIIGSSMKLSQLAISNLAIAALFHDIGMLKIPRDILEKVDPLTDGEISIIRTHPSIGYKFLREVNYSAIIASGALQHHERIDGKGYPNKLTKDKITEVSKIISVADAYCAAIASKPFKQSPAHAKEVILELLKSGGSAYSPVVLKELIKNISFYPIGSLVLLSNDLPARVVGNSGVAMKPIVRVISKDENAGIVDLSKRNDIYIKDMYDKKELKE
jgi:HD-GYP domain-containing protein (c-di-GMP phosphodiesterase class II)